MLREKGRVEGRDGNLWSNRLIAFTLLTSFILPNIEVDESLFSFRLYHLFHLLSPSKPPFLPPSLSSSLPLFFLPCLHPCLPLIFLPGLHHCLPSCSSLLLSFPAFLHQLNSFSIANFYPLSLCLLEFL